MPLSTIDPRTALLVIDLQRGIVAAAAAHAADRVIHSAAALCDIFRERGLPVVLVNVVGRAPGRTEQSPPPADAPDDWATLVPELGERPTDHRVSKRSWGAFTNTDLHAHLMALGVTQVVVCGISTSAGVESTARQAYELGYNVTIAVDAVTDRDPDAHRNSIERILPRIGECGTVAEVRALLGRGAG